MTKEHTMQQNKYADIIHLPHPVSQRHCRMTNYDRAAQFSPFAALTGYDAVIAETARLTDAQVELDEAEMEILNGKLLEIGQRLEDQPKITVTYFAQDAKKAGGAYLRATGHVKKLDLYSNAILLTDGRAIPVCQIRELELLEDHSGLY